MDALGQMVIDEVGKGSYVLADAPVIQIRKKNYSAAKLRETIDWKPEVDLLEGIRNTVESQRRAPVDDYSV